MHKIMLFLAITFASLYLFACTSNTDGFNINNDLVEKEQYQLELWETKSKIVEEFTNERDATATSELHY